MNRIMVYGTTQTSDDIELIMELRVSRKINLDEHTGDRIKQCLEGKAAVTSIQLIREAAVELA